MRQAQHFLRNVRQFVTGQVQLSQFHKPGTKTVCVRGAACFSNSKEAYLDSDGGSLVNLLWLTSRFCR